MKPLMKPGTSMSRPAGRDEQAVDGLVGRQLARLDRALHAAQHAQALDLGQPGAGQR